MASLTEVLARAPASRNDFNYWKDYLQTPYAKTSPGVARELSRANALELLFVAPLVRAGVKIEAAVQRAAEWTLDVTQPDFDRFYLIDSFSGAAGWASGRESKAPGFAGGRLDFVSGNLVLEIKRPRGAVGTEADAARWRSAMFCVIDRLEIVRRVDEMFDRQES